MSEKSEFRPIIVTRHAIEEYVRRLQDPRLQVLEEHRWSLDKRPVQTIFQQVDGEIRDCVKAALQGGIVLDHRPPGFLLYKSKNKALPRGQRFIQCDSESRYGFIIKRVEEGDIVVTTLTRVGVHR